MESLRQARRTPMSRPPSLKKNYILNVLLSLVNIGYPILTLGYVARTIGPQHLGRFYLAFSLTGYFVLLAGLGLPLYGARVLRYFGDHPANCHFHGTDIDPEL